MIDDLLVCSQGTLDGLVRAANLAITDGATSACRRRA
jgi:hypothetical protein